MLRSHGGVRTGAWFQYEEAGFNYRLSDVLSAIGVAQMEKLPWLVERRRELAMSLSERISQILSVRIPFEPKWGGHIYQSYVILVDENINRDKVVEDMKAKGIETTLGTYALHDQPFFQRQFGYKTGQIVNSHAAFTRTITLPLYPQINEIDLDVIADTLKVVIKEQTG
jgi:dTDP-4-amino-4,6-dideoxygalactose transaminase